MTSQKKVRSKSKGSGAFSGKKFSKEEKQRIIHYLMGEQAQDKPQQRQQQYHRRFPNFNESCEVPSFSQAHLTNEQIVNILAERNEVEMQKVESSLHKPISKSVQKKETAD